MSAPGGSPGGSGFGGSGAASGIGAGIYRAVRMNRPKIPSYNEILPRLYLGDIQIAMNKAEITRLGITDMITVEIKPLQASDLAACVKRYLFINVMDHWKQDILSHFDTSYEFIESALKVPTNKIYVHCVAGISRSASIVIAYIMKSRSISYREAYQLVSDKRRCIEPNDGFANQLQLYEKMRYTIDIANSSYRKMVLEALVFEFRLVALSYYQTTSLRKHSRAPTIFTNFTLVNVPTPAQKNLASQNNIGILFDQYYSKLHLQEVNNYPQVYNPASASRCNKCRAIVFYDVSIIEDKNCNLISLNTSTTSTTSGRNLAKQCPFIFIEPQPWMDKSILEPAGNLECYKCKRKLGKFDWSSNESCSCDAHNSQLSMNLFKIMRKKVDSSR